jgi:hypothetical protein
MYVLTCRLYDPNILRCEVYKKKVTASLKGLS